MRRGVVHGMSAEQTEGADEQTIEGAAAGAARTERTSEGIKAVSVQSMGLQTRLRTAVEARRQEGAESPSSIVLLLDRSLLDHDKTDRPRGCGERARNRVSAGVPPGAGSWAGNRVMTPA